MNTNNGEFRGSTKQALQDMSEDIRSLQAEVASLRGLVWRSLTIISLLLTVAVIERIPDFVKVIGAVASGG